MNNTTTLTAGTTLNYSGDFANDADTCTVIGVVACHEMTGGAVYTVRYSGGRVSTVFDVQIGASHERGCRFTVRQ